MNASTTQVTLAELIALFYDEYLALYGDEELASVAAAATINDILAEQELGVEPPPVGAANEPPRPVKGATA